MAPLQPGAVPGTFTVLFRQYIHPTIPECEMWCWNVDAAAVDQGVSECVSLKQSTCFRIEGLCKNSLAAYHGARHRCHRCPMDFLSMSQLNEASGYRLLVIAPEAFIVASDDSRPGGPRYCPEHIIQKQLVHPETKAATSVHH